MKILNSNIIVPMGRNTIKKYYKEIKDNIEAYFFIQLQYGSKCNMVTKLYSVDSQVFFLKRDDNNSDQL